MMGRHTMATHYIESVNKSGAFDWAMIVVESPMKLYN